MKYKTNPGWVKVEDGMPEEKGMAYIIFTFNDIFISSCYYDELEKKGVEFWSYFPIEYKWDDKAKNWQENIAPPEGRINNYAEGEEDYGK